MMFDDVFTCFYCILFDEPTHLEAIEVTERHPSI